MAEIQDYARVGDTKCLGVELASRDPKRLAEFYVDVLGFRCEQLAPESARLRLGEGIIWLVRAAPAGRRIPKDSRSDDRWFRHIAIVVRDLPAAHRRLLGQDISIISDSPQVLPKWNTNSAGIEAVYFRDLEDHPVELIHFPPDKGKPIWHRHGHELFQGIDHTAIVVANAQASAEFYLRTTGLQCKAEAVNEGLEQERLTGVAGARMKVVSLPGAGEMGLELLEYLNPLSSRLTPIDTSPNDTWWSRTVIIDGVRAPTQFFDPDHHGVLLK